VWVRDRESFRRHFFARVGSGSKGAQGFDVHQQRCTVQVAVLARRWWEMAMDWKSTQETWAQGYGGYGAAVVKAMGGRRRRVRSTATRDILFIRGSTGSTRCGSFCRTVLIATALF
jgi:hypothetical protein